MSYNTAGIIIIGDEILKGHVKDENCDFLCQRCFLWGIRVRRISIIADDVDEISEETRKFSALYDLVITTGGVGPTHDDVTYEGVANAFNESLYRNEEMLKSFGLQENIDKCILRLVTIPASSEVLYLNVPSDLSILNIFPLVRVRNVFVLPGVPKYVRYLFCQLEEMFFKNSANKMFYVRTVFLKKDEEIIAPKLYNVVNRFKDIDSVKIGSYPEFDVKSKFKTKIIIESSIVDDCLSAESALLLDIPASWIVYMEPDFNKTVDYSQFSCFLRSNGDLVSVVQKSLQLIEECLSKYDVPSTFLSFNGGKDCTVLLYLLYYCLRKQNGMNSCHSLKALYSCHIGTFSEEKDFVYKCCDRYGLDLTVIKGSVKESLSSYLNKYPDIKVAFLGIRGSDPGGKNVKPIQMTDKDWPQVLRVFPLLEWTYDDIWNFLRAMNVPYCPLYNYGYTSIGEIHNTVPNPALIYKDVEMGSTCYRPAFLLGNISAEREGRPSS